MELKLYAKVSKIKIKIICNFKGHSIRLTIQ